MKTELIGHGTGSSGFHLWIR